MPEYLVVYNLQIEDRYETKFKKFKATDSAEAADLATGKISQSLRSQYNLKGLDLKLLLRVDDTILNNLDSNERDELRTAYFRTGEL